MKFEPKNEKEAKIEKDIPGLEEYLNEELLELHYCRKGTTMRIKTDDPKTMRIMVGDIIGHLLSEIPEEERNDVLLMAIKSATFDDLVQ